MTPRPAPAGRTRFDIADIVRAHRDALASAYPLTAAQRRVLTDIAQCRTAVLGGHVDTCHSCGYDHPSYNSCRNRHCPKCQALTQEEWIDGRRRRLLPVGHFHVVFTLPAQLRPLARIAPRVVYDALFHAAAQTLVELGTTRLRARVAATLVLHTWTRELDFHPHVHAIVSAGGLALDGSRWIHARRGYLFPVKVMGKLLRGKVLAELRDAHAAGRLPAEGVLRDPMAFDHILASVAKLAWNVYAKAPFRKRDHVLAYLGRYTHRVGIANSRLLAVSDDAVVFATRDGKTKTLAPVEFLRRLVQHVLPDGLHKIRHAGLYASAADAKHAAATEKLATPLPPPQPRPSWQERLLAITGHDVSRCRKCGQPVVSVFLPPFARAPPP